MTWTTPELPPPLPSTTPHRAFRSRIDRTVEWMSQQRCVLYHSVRAHHLEEDSAEFRIWYEGHQDVCSPTHVGSSGAMEVNAAVKLLDRFESIDFRYTTLLSDGDSKSFLELKERNVYGNETQIKKACINHVSQCFSNCGA
ncbi:uncharacterized protein TNCV_1610201 [Trichonephila clavipes]|nr:uncharacterized protein TNCV_1610201 [Trichonephila clavipes]